MKVEILVILLMLGIFYKELTYMRALIIRSKNSIVTHLATGIGMITIAIITYSQAKTFFGYLLGALGVILVFMMCHKDGIAENGIQITSKGKELFTWNEIYSAEIKKTDSIIVTYYSEPCSEIVKQCYSLTDEERLLALLQANIHISKITK